MLKCAVRGRCNQRTRSSVILNAARHLTQAGVKSEQPTDTDALFEPLFRDYRQALLNYIHRLVGNSMLAEELTPHAERVVVASSGERLLQQCHVLVRVDECRGMTHVTHVDHLHGATK
jgi:hypothetical protein